MRGFLDLPHGHGMALDLGGRHGELEEGLRRAGYEYVNVDLEPDSGVCGDAHRLPFRDGAFAVVTSKDTLEHFGEPWVALAEARRVLIHGGRLVVDVPFMHPFHGDDLWRYTPLGLRRLLDVAGFEVKIFEGRHGLFTALAMTFGSRFRRWEQPVIKLAQRLDRIARRFGTTGEAAAHSFFVMAVAR